MSDFDIAIIGAGMAGASLASALGSITGGQRRVLLIEGEERPGYHATGRSAAFWTESYGGPDVQPLTTASGAFLRNPPADHGARSFLIPRTALTIARDDDKAALQTFADSFAGSGVRMERLGRRELEARIPGLLPAWQHGIIEPDCCDIDVAALHQAYLGRAARLGTAMAMRSPLSCARYAHGRWTLRHGTSESTAAILVNAAGAWADQVAVMAGVQPLGLMPLRRTVAQLRVSPPVPADLPLVLDVGEQFYFKPEAGRLWLSPHDETPSPPCDAAAEELDVALALDRLAQVVNWRIDAVERRWAGLRTFAPDRLPVYGRDPDQPGFFWFAGQGGFGIQTAPAAAQLGAALLLEQGVDPAIKAAKYAPDRLR